MEPEYSFAPGSTSADTIIYENKPFSYIMEPKNAVLFKSLIFLKEFQKN